MSPKWSTAHDLPRWIARVAGGDVVLVVGVAVDRRGAEARAPRAPTSASYRFESTLDEGSTGRLVDLAESC